MQNEVCYECSAYGDDRYYDKDWVLIRLCETCPFNTSQEEDYE